MSRFASCFAEPAGGESAGDLGDDEHAGADDLEIQPAGRPRMRILVVGSSRPRSRAALVCARGENARRARASARRAADGAR